jgi:predicted deacetylase
MSARYLLRVDDVCPTMNWTAWRLVEDVFRQFDVRPILAVVPDNRDSYLEVDPPAPDFWDRVAQWRSWGWEIAMHGYQHRYVTDDGGLLGINPRSEFAGLSRAEQAAKLEASRDAFAARGLTPRVWVAPGHSFDDVTLDLLPDVGIEVVSDGAALLPHRDRRGLVWLPQQSERFMGAPAGVWTVCLHVNRWDERRVARLAADLERHRRRLTHVDEVVAAYGTRRRGAVDRVVAVGLQGLRHLRRTG